MPRSTSKPRPDIIEIGPNDVFIDGKMPKEAHG